MEEKTNFFEFDSFFEQYQKIVGIPLNKGLTN